MSPPRRDDDWWETQETFYQRTMYRDNKRDV